MAGAFGSEPKHATKQVDRFLSRSAIDLDSDPSALCAYLLAGKSEASVALDWTEFDGDDRSILCIYLLTQHGRALPLLWKTMVKSDIAGHRTAEEIALVRRLHAIVPADIELFLLADQSFGYHALFETLNELGLEFVIRMSRNIDVANATGERRLSIDWLSPNGRVVFLKDVKITQEDSDLQGFIAVQRAAMKEPWLLATSLSEHTADKVIRLYGKRFTIEETFRDQKDNRFGLGLKATRIRSVHRRDRLLLLCALAYLFITLLGK